MKPQLNLQDGQFQEKQPVVFSGMDASLGITDFFRDEFLWNFGWFAARRIEEAQLINYLKATGHKVGLLINFGSKSLEYKRLVYNFQPDPQITQIFADSKEGEYTSWIVETVIEEHDNFDEILPVIQCSLSLICSNLRNLRIGENPW